MKLIKIKKECHDANLKLSKSALSFQNFGNISTRIDKDKFIIKPSGADLDKTKYLDYPVISISKRKKYIVNSLFRTFLLVKVLLKLHRP